MLDRDGGGELAARWARVRGRLRTECGETVYRSWLRSLTLVRRDGDTVVLSVPSRFVRDRVTTQYGDRLRALWTDEESAVHAIEVIVANGASIPEAEAGLSAVRPAEIDDGDDHEVVDQHRPRAAVRRPADSTEALSAPLDQRFTFANFVVGKPNELAFAAARRVAESETVPFNPLFLYGGVGLGKTHLMHAIAWNLREKHPQRRVLYMSAEKFM